MEYNQELFTIYQPLQISSVKCQIKKTCNTQRETRNTKKSINSCIWTKISFLFISFV